MRLSEENKIRLQKAGIFAMGVGISFTIAAFAMPTGNVVCQGLYYWVGYDVMSKIASLVPKFMRFIGDGSGGADVNFRFYFAITFAAIVTALAVWALCKMYANSKKVGERDYKLEVMDPLKNQTISCHSGEHELDSQHVVLYVERPYGCEVQIGKKTLILEYVGPETYVDKDKVRNWCYKVVGYENTENPEIAKGNFLAKYRGDLFENGEHTRNDATISQPSKLKDVIYEALHRKENEGSRSL